MSKILGIDFGSVRVGLAVSNEDQTIAFPRVVLESSEEVIMPYIKDLIEAENISTIIIGLPLSFGGEDTKTTEKVRAFAVWIEKNFKVPTIFQNEVLSSKMAKQHITDKKLLDARAAALILQSYLDKNKRASLSLDDSE